MEKHQMRGICRCGAQHDQAPVHSFSRRTTIAGLLGAPMLATPGWAQDLLDPTTLRSARVSSPADLPDRQRPADRLSPSYARGMASSVTSALLSLVRAYGGVADQIGKLTDKDKDLAAKLDAAIRDKAAKLEEYRQGLFCSGCGKTKSEILARGEQFPHSGQTIIKPTPEQIAAKERELQAIIDRLANELKAVREQRAKLDPDINAIKDQLFEGMGLWRTAVSFHGRLLRQEDLDNEDAYVRERRRISTQLDAAPKEAAAAIQPAVIQRGIDDLKSWVETLNQVESRRAAERRQYNEALATADTTARREVVTVQNEANAVAAKITAFGLSGYLTILTTIMSPAVSPANIGEASGYMFRMGKYDRATIGQILPNVAEFVGRARNVMPVLPRGSAPSASQELRVAESNISRLQSRLSVARAQEQRQREIEEARRQQLAQEQASKEPGF